MLDSIHRFYGLGWILLAFYLLIWDIYFTPSGLPIDAARFKLLSLGTGLVGFGGLLLVINNDNLPIKDGYFLISTGIAMKALTLYYWY
jgi:hypothetical protein